MRSFLVVFTSLFVLFVGFSLSTIYDLDFPEDVEGNRLNSSTLHRRNGNPNCTNKLPLVRNGFVGSGESYTDANRVVACRPNFILVGASMITCRAKGWTTPGECRRASEKYQLVKGRMSWYDAVMKCKELEGQLAMPKTVVDNAVIINLMLRNSAYMAWFGLSRIVSGSQQWHWVDGTLVEANSYQGWLPGAPNNPFESCAHFQIVEKPNRNSSDPQQYGWNDFFCAHNRTMDGYGIGAVCELPS